MNNLEEIVKKVREKVQYVILGGASGGATVYRIARYFLSYHWQHNVPVRPLFS
jgi:hypothetical protein